MMTNESPLAKLQNEYDRLRAMHGFMEPAIVEYTSRRATGGVIRYSNWKHPHYHIISISSHMPFEEQMETLRHEAAHAYCGHAAGHNTYFWKTAALFGCTRKGAPITEETKRKREDRVKRIYECPNCGQTFTWRRKLTTTKIHIPCRNAGINAHLRLISA